VQLAATNIAEMIERADAQYPGFRARVLDDNGEVKRFINVFVNGVDIRTLQGKQTPIKEGDEVSVIPAMAGG
jgi:molybdopterin synthase sulfur carrier subunit